MVATGREPARAPVVAVTATLAGLAFTAWLYATPYLVLETLHAAAARGDLAALAAHGEFAAIRASLLASLRAGLDHAAKSRRGTRPDPTLAARVAEVVEQTIARDVTRPALPDIATAMDGLAAALALRGSTVTPVMSARFTAALASGVERGQTGYTGLSTFTVTFGQPDGWHGTVRLRRTGLATWRLTALDLEQAVPALLRAATELRREHAVQIAGPLVDYPLGTTGTGCSGDARGCTAEGSGGPTATLPPFRLARNPVTRAQWQACVADHGCERRTDATSDADVRPVTGVSPDDARQFITWLNDRSGLRFRLPRALEWDHAAPAGDVREWVEGCAPESRTGTRVEAAETTRRVCGRLLIRGGPSAPTRNQTAPPGFRLAHTQALPAAWQAFEHGDYPRARALAEREAALGQADADYLTGLVYRDGLGTRKDARRAVTHFRRAAARGHVRALVALVYAYGFGDGVETDVVRARRLLGELAGRLAGDFVTIPGGTFRMGCADGDTLCSGSERPAHDVAVKAFRMGLQEVTFAQWDTCVEDGGCPHRPGDQGGQRNTQPVRAVSWDDVQTFLRWLNGKTRRQFRLPSEAEWEYAARGGVHTAGPWEDASVGVCDDAGTGTRVAFHAARDACNAGVPPTDPAGSLAANAFGLHALLGNVAEWTADCWHEGYTDAPRDGRARAGGDCSARVVRGASWNHDPAGVRASSRLRAPVFARTDDRGFRIAEDLPQEGINGVRLDGKHGVGLGAN